MTGALSGATTVTASTGFVLGDGDYIGITGNEIITFNAAGSIAITGATFDVDGAMTATTLGSDGIVTATTNVVIGDAGNIGSSSDTDAIAIAADGKTTFTQDMNLSEDLIITDAKYIGSTSDPDAMQIEADGDIVLTQDIAIAGTTTTTGGLLSLTPITDDADNFAANFTGANLYGGTFVANATGTAQLPVMVAGMNFCIITLGAIAVIADTNVADGYLMDGTTGVEGANLTNLSTAGDIACFQYYTADDWLITTNGWTAE
jgi:hypothetical protein